MNNSIQIIENLLDKDALQNLNDVLLGRNFPFYWHDDIDEETTNSNSSNFGFSHELFNCRKDSASPHLPAFDAMMISAVKKLGVEFLQLLRMRVVLLTNTGKSHENRKHTDLGDSDYSTFVFYPHETDGDFFIYENGDKIRIPIAQNMCIFMKTPIPHHGSMPITHSRRIVVNVNFTISE